MFKLLTPPYTAGAAAPDSTEQAAGAAAAAGADAGAEAAPEAVKDPKSYSVNQIKALKKVVSDNKEKIATTDNGPSVRLALGTVINSVDLIRRDKALIGMLHKKILPGVEGDTLGNFQNKGPFLQVMTAIKTNFETGMRGLDALGASKSLNKDEVKFFKAVFILVAKTR